ncbi:MAG: hypothetical protein ABI240_13190 [Sphingomonas sp.]
MGAALSQVGNHEAPAARQKPAIRPALRRVTGLFFLPGVANTLSDLLIAHARQIFSLTASDAANAATRRFFRIAS